jgi:hypothetical protein
MVEHVERAKEAVGNPLEVLSVSQTPNMYSKILQHILEYSALIQITETTLQGRVKIFVQFSTAHVPATNKKTEDEKLLKLPLPAQHHTSSRIRLPSKEKSG